MPTRVKEILSAAADLIGRSDLAREAESESSSSEELSLLLRCFNIIQNEVALDYFQLKRQDNFIVRTNKISYTELYETPTAILGVTRAETGEPVPYEVFPDYIALNVQDVLTVTYTYAPQDKKLTDSVVKAPCVSVRLLAYGTAAEFLLACGRFSEAAVLDKRYREAISAAASVKTPLKVRARRWS